MNGTSRTSRIGLGLALLSLTGLEIVVLTNGSMLAGIIALLFALAGLVIFIISPR